jgi:hypothetical protein
MGALTRCYPADEREKALTPLAGESRLNVEQRFAVELRISRDLKWALAVLPSISDIDNIRACINIFVKESNNGERLRIVLAGSPLVADSVSRVPWSAKAER